MRPQILGCNQMLFTRPHESFPKIDNHRASHINFERCFLDRFAIGLEMKAGTHADARFHFETDGETIEKAPLEVYMGRAVVGDLWETFVRSSEKHLITTEDLRPHSEEIAETLRLLIKTGRWSDSEIFPNQIPVISADVPGWLQKNGVKLLGLDLL